MLKYLLTLLFLYNPITILTLELEQLQQQLQSLSAQIPTSKKRLCDELKERVKDATKELKERNSQLESGHPTMWYRVMYGCATPDGERLQINNSPELWHTVDSAANFERSEHVMLNILAHLFTKYWERLTELRRGLKLELSNC